MAFPRELLSDDEDVVVDMHPHWITMVPISMLLAGVVLGGLVVFVNAGDGSGWLALRVLVGLAVLATLIGFAQRYAKWATTEFVVTNLSLIHI